MINIIFYCNWNMSPKEILNKYKLMTPQKSGVWNIIQGVTNIEDAHIIIFIEGIPKSFDMKLLEKKTILCFPREPNVKKNWEIIKKLSKYTYNNIIHVVTNPQFINKDYDFLSNLLYKESTKRFSAIISNKNMSLEYRIRRNTLILLSKKYPGLCDIYGAGWKDELGSSYKGELGCYHKMIENNSITKYHGLIDYKYSLCIENCSIKNYFTEKFTDAILCWTIPIYYGCPNIGDFFPEDSYYSIDINDKHCIEKIKDIVEKPITKNNLIALEHARYLILNKYNIWNVIQETLL